MNEEAVVDYRVVGPICETGDFFALDRCLPPVKEGDLIAIFSAGAYGFVMSSNYNSRGRAAEIMVDDTGHYLVRERETVADLLRFSLVDEDDLQLATVLASTAAMGYANAIAWRQMEDFNKGLEAKVEERAGELKKSLVESRRLATDLEESLVAPGD